MNKLILIFSLITLASTGHANWYCEARCGGFQNQSVDLGGTFTYYILRGAILIEDPVYGEGETKVSAFEKMKKNCSSSHILHHGLEGAYTFFISPQGQTIYRSGNLKLATPSTACRKSNE